MQQAIKEAKKMIEELSGYVNFGKVDAIKELIERLDKLPQELSLEELLEEMPVGVSIIKRGKGYEPLYYPLHEKTILYNIQKTPREALIALKEKLTLSHNPD